MDLGPLRCLPKLESLILVSGELEFIGTLRLDELEPLAKLTQLQRLDLSCTGAVSLEPLRGLRHLETLDLTRTPARDLSVLSKLELKWLGLREKDFKDSRQIEVLKTAQPNLRISQGRHY